MTTNKKKKSAARKLVPAAGMLAVSAAMLASSTYAWFTMSREVEVTGIKMTASVPEDLQISLGTIGTAVDTPETSESGKSLVNSNGVLVESEEDGGASDGKVLPPSHTWDWSNSADISSYYAFGRLIPASSSTGQNIFYTPDANGVGKTVKDEASYYQAAAADVAYGTNFTVDGSTGAITYAAAAANATSARATLHAFTAEKDGADDTWTDATTVNKDYTQAADWKNTNDDGYYVDIPIWIRSSSNAAVGLTVDGYVLPGDKWVDGTAKKKQTELELYRAVRVAILNGATITGDDDTGRVAATIGTPANATGSILPLKDAWNTAKNGDADVASPTTFEYTAITPLANKFGGDSILDSANLRTSGRTLPSALTAENFTNVSTAIAGVASSSTSATAGADGVSKYYTGTYNVITPYDGTNATVATKTITTIPGSTTGGQYGEAKKLIIRVWLDGEDGECWNDNAGQDWAISLKFSKIESNS